MCAAHQADNHRSAFARTWKDWYTLFQMVQFWDLRSTEFPLVFTHSFFLARDMKIIKTTLLTLLARKVKRAVSQRMQGVFKGWKREEKKIVHIGNAALALALWDSGQDADRTTDDNQSVVFNLQTLAITYNVSRKLMQPCHSHSDFTLNVLHFQYYTNLKKINQITSCGNWLKVTWKNFMTQN